MLAGVLGIVLGFLLSKTFEVGTVKVKESPFGLEAGTRISKGRDFGGISEIKSLSNEDREKFRMASALAVSSNPKSALDIFEELKKKYPNFFLGEGARAFVYVACMDTSTADGALADASIHAALSKDPDHPWLHYVAGLYFDRMHRPDSSMAHYRSAVKSAPHFAYAHLRLGRVQMEMGEIGPARTSFHNALGLMESNPELYTPGPKFVLPVSEVPPYDFLATLFFQNGSEDSALMALEVSQEKGLKSDQMDLVQAWLWEGHGFLRKADSVYHRLVEKNPRDPNFAEALATLGWKPASRKGTTRPSDAEAIFAVSLLDPLARQHTHNAPLWMALGQAYFRRGMFGLATESFDSSLKYEPTLPALNEKRDAAYNALIRENDRPLTAEEAKKQRPRFHGPSMEDQTPVVIPGSIALLGTYSVAWGSSQTQVRQTYPKKEFVNLPGGNLLDTFVQDGLKHSYFLAFRDGKLWGIRVLVSDSARNTGDVFGRTIRTKVKISGEGKGTGEASCPGSTSFQGVIWENDDTFEFMAQFKGKENQVHLVRIGHDYLPSNRRLCDMAKYLSDAVWR